MLCSIWRMLYFKPFLNPILPPFLTDYSIFQTFVITRLLSIVLFNIPQSLLIHRFTSLTDPPCRIGPLHTNVSVRACTSCRPFVITSKSCWILLLSTVSYRKYLFQVSKFILRWQNFVTADLVNYNTYIAPQAATAAAAALYVTDRADVQSIGCRLGSHTRACSLPAKQPHAQLWPGVKLTPPP